MDPFFDVPTERFPTSAGSVDLPILYRDGSLLTLIYRVAEDRAAALLPEGFEPMPILGKALVVVSLFEYRDTTIGPYHELGIGIQAKRVGSNPSLFTYLTDIRAQEEQGLWVVNLPVTTERARAGGADLWGLPKYVAKMQSRFADDELTFDLEGELSLTMQRGRGIRMKGLPFVIFSHRDGRILRTTVEVQHQMRFGGAASVRLTRTGDGPCARTVEALGLDQMQPWLAQRTDDLRAVLPRGVDVGASVEAAPLAVAV